MRRPRPVAPAAARRLAPRSSLATPCRTVITKAAQKTLISPNSTSSASSSAARAQDDQLNVLVISLDLRPHVNVQRILDRQLMQAEVHGPG